MLKYTYLGLGFVAQDLLDLREHVWRQLRDDIERLQVIDDLLGPRRAEDNGARVRVDRDPRESKMGHRAAELWNG